MLSQTECIKAYLLDLQQEICVCLQEEDGGSFIKDRWDRENGGFGYTCALENGKVIEKAGVNFSHIFGETLPPAASQKNPELAGCPFEALGISVIVHPRNPNVPTTHFNVRFFSAKTKEKEIWWIGGGFDLTPYYGFIEDCVHWHEMSRAACQPFGEDLYPRFKKWADDYFYLKHRQESRGIGGLFFDDLKLKDFETSFEFMRSVGTHFLLAYLPILQKRKHTPYTEAQRDFQKYRRGRYVEFNLVYDRGTVFGLQWGGRVESILISLPSEVTWRYNWTPVPGSEEAQLYEVFLPPREWVAVKI